MTEEQMRDFVLGSVRSAALVILMGHRNFVTESSGERGMLPSTRVTGSDELFSFRAIGYFGQIIENYRSSQLVIMY
jgi:hypothetical protein